MERWGTPGTGEGTQGQLGQLGTGDGGEGPLSPQLAELARLAEEAREHQERQVADSTRRYLSADWRQYERWCTTMGVVSVPVDPRLVSLYITDLARQLREDGTLRYKASTIGRHVASLARRAVENGEGRGLAQHEQVAGVLAGIRRQRGEQVEAKRPLLLDDLRILVSSMDHSVWPAGVRAARDSFALLLGFTTAVRRSELAGLLSEHLVPAPLDGLHVRVVRSKTDQEGAGAVLAVPFGTTSATCVPCARIRWLRLLADRGDRAAQMRHVFDTPSSPADWDHVCRSVQPQVDATAPVFVAVNRVGGLGDRAITGTGVNEMLKRRLAEAGYDPGPYGMHSLRAGFVTQARRNGASIRETRRQSRHRTEAMVDHYDREWLPMTGNGVLKLGL